MVVHMESLERAVCRLRYRVVSEYIEPGDNLGPNAICKAIASGSKNGSEYSPLLPLFGGARTVERNWKKRDDEADQLLAEEWVATQPAGRRAEIRTLLGLAPADVQNAQVEESEEKVAPSTSGSTGVKRRRGSAAQDGDGDSDQPSPKRAMKSGKRKHRAVKSEDKPKTDPEKQSAVTSKGRRKTGTKIKPKKESEDDIA